MRMDFQSQQMCKDLFDKKVVITAREKVVDALGTKLEAKKEEAYIRVEAAMKALLIKSLDRKFSLQLLNLERFVEQWAALEDNVLGEKTTYWVRRQLVLSY